MTVEDINDKFRSREIDRSDPVRTLLNSLTLESIREAVYALAPNLNIRIKSHANSHEEILKTKRSQSDIVIALLEAEALTPFKHALVAHSRDPGQIRRLGAEVRNTRQALGFDLLVRHYFERGAYAYVTFEHVVAVREWVDGESENTRVLDNFDTRHPIVLRVNLTTGLFLIGYPGFSQGTATKRNLVISYYDLLSAVSKSLGDLGVETRPLPIRESLKILLAGPNRRVHRVRADIEAANVGRFDLSSLDQKKTIEESLADLLLPHMEGASSRQDFVDSAKRAINNVEANFIVLAWSEESVLTRLKFWDIGCEFLFTWNGEKASFRAIESIMALLLEAAPRVQHGVQSAIRWISSCTADEVITPARFSEVLQLTSDVARRELLYAVKAGLLAIVYRLNTNGLVIGTMNAWVEDPKLLRRVWDIDGGESLDGGDPRNIEVAFRRISVGSDK